MFMEIRTDLFLGDSKQMLKKLSDNSVDLVVTSPPYADQNPAQCQHTNSFTELFASIPNAARQAA
jgi:site-specific DNA-methyltransferase (adenine-specific)/site-specific DNA-methyltransferase (cytosine-N4-specific)